MVQASKENLNQFKVTVDGGVSELISTQTALIDLLQCCDYGALGDDTQSTVYYTLNLLSALMPDEKQLKRCFGMDENTITLPDELNTKQKKLIKEAVEKVSDPDTQTGKNTVYDAIVRIAK